MGTGGNEWIGSHPWIVPLLVVAYLWVIFQAVAWASGWRALAARFRADHEPYGDCPRAGGWFTRVYLRYWTKYSGAIRLAAAPEGLYISVILFMRLGHPPLCVPWGQIATARTDRFLQRWVELRLGHAEQIPMRISEATARELGLDKRLGSGSC